jgi:hypothetical protein
MKKLSVKGWFLNTLRESEEPFYRLASTDVKSVSEPNINPEKKIVSIAFITNDDKNRTLKVQDKVYKTWNRLNKDTQSTDATKNFLMWFLDKSKPMDGVLTEVVDEFNSLIGDDDMPNNSDNRMIGMSSRDSNAISQITSKPIARTYNWGLGFVTW